MEQFWGALSLVYLQLGLCQSGCCGFMERGPDGTGSSSGSFAVHPRRPPCPHCCPILAPGLFRIHGCAISPAPRGLRGILETFIFQFFFLFKFYLCLYFGSAGSSFLHRFVSRWGEWRPRFSQGAQASHCSGFSCWRSPALGRFSTCSRVLSCCGSRF